MSPTRSTSTIPPLHVCQCCTAHSDIRLVWEVVTCPVCKQPCSCEGCVAEDCPPEPWSA